MHTDFMCSTVASVHGLSLRVLQLSEWTPIDFVLLSVLSHRLVSYASVDKPQRFSLLAAKLTLPLAVASPRLNQAVGSDVLGSALQDALATPSA
jgi:hypothetical protein